MGDEAPIISILRSQYKTIKENLHTSDKIIDVLYQEKFISRSARERILSLAKSDQSRGIDIFIKDLVNYFQKLDQKYYDDKAYELSKKFDEHGCKHLLEAQRDNLDQESDAANACALETRLSDIPRLLRSKRSVEILKDDLEPKRIIDDLVVAGALSFDDHEDIFINGFRKDRVEILLRNLMNDVSKNGRLFLSAIRKERPSLEKKLWKNFDTTNDEGSTDVSIEVEKKEQGWRVLIEAPMSRECVTAVTLKFNHNKVEISSVQKDISSTEITPELRAEAMDWETCIDSLSFSSVVITLKAHSPRAVTLVLQMVEKPEILKRFLNSLLTVKQKQDLWEAGWNNLSVEVKTLPNRSFRGEECLCHIVRQVLLRKKECVYFFDCRVNIDAILRRIYPMRLITHDERKDIRYLLRVSNINEKKTGFFRLFESICHGKCCALESAMKDTEGYDEFLNLYDPDCTSILSKSVLKESTEIFLVQPIRDIECFLEELESIPLLLSKGQTEIINKLKQSSDDTIALDLMELLLTLPNSCVCRFEIFLKRTYQGHLLCLLKQHNDLLASGELTETEIEENITFLCTEIDPKLFRHIFEDKEEERLSDRGSRYSRCQTFFKNIHNAEKCDLYVRKFVATLDDLKLYHILRILNSSKSAKNPESARVYGEILKHKVLDNKDLILEEVDVELLKTTFVDRGIFGVEEFESITNEESRKFCVVNLLNKVIEQGYAAIVCFIDALKIGGYSFVAGTITNTPAQLIPCPCFIGQTKAQTLLKTTFSVQLITSENGKKGRITQLDSVDTIVNTEIPPQCSFRDNKVYSTAHVDVQPSPGKLSCCSFKEAIDIFSVDSSKPMGPTSTVEYVELLHLDPKQKTVSTSQKGSKHDSKDGENSICSNKKRSYKTKGDLIYFNLGFTPRHKLSVREYINRITWKMKMRV